MHGTVAHVEEKSGLAQISTLPVVTTKKASFSPCISTLWPDITTFQWNDWRWQLANRIRNFDKLSQIIKLTPEEEEGVRRSEERLAMAITPYWASLMDPEDPNCPIRRQAVPTREEFYAASFEMKDPCAEDRDSPVPGLVHRYPDRVLLLVTDHCAMYCRHCTRRRRVGEVKETTLDLKAALEYMRSSRRIRDVLISGGDPFMLPTEQLEDILLALRSLNQIELLRIGTRVPITLPQRISPELINLLKQFSPLWISLHVNHPKELTKESRAACHMLADSGFPLGSQTVLLKGINDRPSVMKRLMHELVKNRIRPYYIYQCDPVKGTSHFRTPVAVGINIIEKLRGHTSGYAVPTYVIDAPGGGGKIPIGPNYLLSQAKGKYVLRNYKGKIFTYLE